MKAPARFKSVRCMLLAVLALAPTAVLAQQNTAPQGQTQQGPDQPKAQGQTEPAQAKTEEPQGQATESQAKSEKDAKAISGMSILGNQEAPKSLVIVPWKSSEMGDSIGISTTLDDSRQPVDKDVFMRALRYYEIRSSKTTGHDGAPAVSDAAPPANAANRRK
jgi:hypothetical protein